MEEPNSDGASQDERVSKGVSTFADASDAMSAADIPCFEIPLQKNLGKSVSTLSSGKPMHREAPCTQGSDNINRNCRFVEECSSPHEPVPSFEPNMQGPMRLPQEHTQVLPNEGSKCHDLGDAYAEGNILNDGCSDTDLLERRNSTARIESDVHSTVHPDELGNSKTRPPNDLSIASNKQTVNLDNDKPPAEVNTVSLEVVKLTSADPQIFGTGIENPLNAEPEVLASLNIDSSRISNAGPLNVRIIIESKNQWVRTPHAFSDAVDGRSLNAATVNVPTAAAPDFQESRRRTTADMEVQAVGSQDGTDSAILPLDLHGAGSQTFESLDLIYPAAAAPDLGNHLVAAAHLEAPTIELHSLADVAAAPQVAVDDVCSSNGKRQIDFKPGQSVEGTSRAQAFLLSDQVEKKSLETSSNSKAENTSETLEVSTASKDETATTSPMPKLTKKQEHYMKFIARKKEARYARKMAAIQAALEISKGTPEPQHGQEHTDTNTTVKRVGTGSNEGHVPPHIRCMLIDRLIE